jgi:hypothetical protein
MPIKPENKKRYPKNWKEISDRIRFGRADGQCEFLINGARCKARHNECHPLTGSLVILTVAHLDHTPEHCEDDNLLAGCQRCHLMYDAKHHAQTAAETRRCKSTKDLFNEKEKQNV